MTSNGFTTPASTAGPWFSSRLYQALKLIAGAPWAGVSTLRYEHGFFDILK